MLREDQPTYPILSDSLEGLSTKEALDRLQNEITEALKVFECNRRKVKSSRYKVISDAFSHNSYYSSFRWTSIVILFFCCIFLLAAYASQEYTRFVTIPLEVSTIFGIIFLNILLTLWETYLRHNELPNLTRRAVTMIRDLISFVYWEVGNYPHLYSPISPCITLQWTKRDSAVVNLPWALLVKGDVIFLRPGQKVPGRCQSLERRKGNEESDIFNYGDVYSPYLEGVGEGFTSPKARTPLQEAPFLLLETPYLIKLDILLSEALNRPITVFNKQCHWLFARGIEFVILPTLVIFVVVINAIRVNYNLWVGHWTEALLVLPAMIALPLVPLGITLANIFLNWIGTASILSIFQKEKLLQNHPSCDPFEGEEIELCKEKIKISWKDVRDEFVKVIKGEQSLPTRTSNLLHVLASVTNLCCVDKKGILSWPNPTAEKVFFLRNRGHNNISSRLNLLSSDLSDNEGDDQHSNLANSKCYSSKESESVVMSLTHDHLTAFGLQFDDVSWKKYLLSLKPLGLNVLLNTCNPATQNHYTKFCSHITCEAMYNEDLVPVSQRRCLCELPKQMGFRSKAQEPFELEHQLCTFRHVPFDMACKDRLARSLSITKLKFPFPHMVSVLLRDKCSGKLELMSQGTADIILDSCTDYWDGYDITHLTEKDRKKIIDFYHRSSLSAYCTAFAYRPTTCTIKENLTKFYLELPIDPSHLYHTARTPTPHISTEALYGDTEHTEYEEISDVEDSYRIQGKQIFIGMVTMQYQAQSDMVRMIEELEEACVRFVHFSKENELRSRVFSEKMGLESGWNCHISLLTDRTRTESGNSSRAGNTSAKTSGVTLYRQSHEDLNSPELNRSKISGHGFYRSKSLRRKFGGIRTGLDVCRALSHSAPSAINLEVAQVKFDEEVSICTKSNSSAAASSEFSSINNEERGFEDCSWHKQGDNGANRTVRDDCNEEELRHLTSGEGINQFQNHEHTISTGFRSPSSLSSSSSSDQSESLNLFDMSNRARLPKGIENIRPHLENVDNVPLLVSLFTDCTMPVTKSMLVIMQEYTEVVMLMGSTANAENIDLFMQADLSLAIDPLHPQVCMREPICSRSAPDCGPPPMEVAGILNSLPCSLSFHREDRISLVHLILKSRHFMQHFMSCFQFWACCNASISILQFVSTAALLPPVLSSGDVLWLVCVPVPLLSISLVFAPTNPAVMDEATGKNKVPINKETLKYIWLYYACKFVPSIVIVLMTTVWIFYAFCQHTASINDWTCDYVYPITYNSSTKHTWGGWGEELAYSHNVIHKTISFQLILYFSTISVSFVHRKYQLWKRNPLTNKVWVGSTISALIMQIIYIKISLSITYKKEGDTPGLRSIPMPVWFILFSWPLLLLLINEFIKRSEIRVNVRYQKRAKLEFGTKLGMNSPF